MKANRNIQRFCLLPVTLYLLICIHSMAQGVDPSAWASFVASQSNGLLRDTFKIQTFADPPSPYNWTYTTIGFASLCNPADEGIPDAPDGGALKMKANSRFKTVLSSVEGHTRIQITAVYAAWGVNPGERLLVTASREEPLRGYLLLDPPEANYHRSFREAKEVNTDSKESIVIGSDPTDFQLDVMFSNELYDGFYALDSVYAHGNIRTFSLFTNTGSWNDNTQWSHRPALRHRSALVNGQATITKPVVCDQIFLGDGNIHIADDQQLTTNKLIVCGEEASLHSSGEVTVREEVVVHRTFPAKGSWYFISFPFDIYPEGLDPAFTWKDDTPNEGGNYFYLYTYNGDKRSKDKRAQDNWEVVPAQTTPGRPVFEKGKGYLIALDEMANTTTLRFSSAPGAVPTDFGKNATLSIPLTVSHTTNKDHMGWYLCGNPLPCPLPTPALVSAALDGYVYLYNGTEYEAFPLEEDHALPPYAAFFVKAKEATTIEIDLSTTVESKSTLYKSEPLYGTKAEPRTSGSPVSTAPSPRPEQPNIYLNANCLYVEDLLMPGVIYLWDAAGRLYWKKTVGAGSSTIHLSPSLPAGIYILRVESKRDKTQYKFSWDQFFSQ